MDSYRDLLMGAMDTHISMVSNRLNVVTERLAGRPHGVNACPSAGEAGLAPGAQGQPV